MLRGMNASARPPGINLRASQALGKSVGRAMAIPAASTARHQRAQRIAEFKRQREQEEQARRDQVIAEFNGDPQAMATEILYYRRSVAQTADAIAWMQAGAPFVSLGPGPYWKPRPTPVLDDREIEDGHP
jgi:hypothetical protein